MVWQDLVVAGANVVFAYSLVYQVYSGFKEKKGFITIQTSLLTSIGLYALTYVYFTLGLGLSTIASGFNATMWLILFLQRIKYKKA